MANRFGNSLCITSFGESHGELTGVVIDGFPSGFAIDETYIQTQLDHRKPGTGTHSTKRTESDIFHIVSGVFEGKTTGAPICIEIRNQDHKSADYESIKDVYRPGHADQVYDLKYGFRDYRGGGRSSARVTAPWVAAGALAASYLKANLQIDIKAVVSSIGKISVENVFDSDWSDSESDALRCPDAAKSEEMDLLIKKTANEGDTLGGTICCRISNCPAGLGEPVFDKLNADIAKAIFSINAVKGLEFGSGFVGTETSGSENNDTPESTSNNEGGINGGISNGKEIRFRVAFKPVSSISKSQKALNRNAEIIDLSIGGRHDVCVLPRAVPIVEAMAALVLADHYLMNLKYEK